jgi:hypothetical protein
LIAQSDGTRGGWRGTEARRPSLKSVFPCRVVACGGAGGLGIFGFCTVQGGSRLKRPLLSHHRVPGRGPPRDSHSRPLSGWAGWPRGHDFRAPGRTAHPETWEPSLHPMPTRCRAWPTPLGPSHGSTWSTSVFKKPAAPGPPGTQNSLRAPPGTLSSVPLHAGHAARPGTSKAQKALPQRMSLDFPTPGTWACTFRTFPERVARYSWYIGRPAFFFPARTV